MKILKEIKVNLKFNLKTLIISIISNFLHKDHKNLIKLNKII